MTYIRVFITAKDNVYTSVSIEAVQKLFENARLKDASKPHKIETVFFLRANFSDKLRKAIRCVILNSSTTVKAPKKADIKLLTYAA